MPFEPEDIPYVPEYITEKKQEGMYLVLAPELPNCISVNATGREIIGLCDSKRTIKEITEILSAETGENPEENLPVLLKFNYLEDRKFAFAQPIEKREFCQKNQKIFLLCG